MSERDAVWIVGAGVIGLSVAYELLRRGRQVRLLDRDERAGVATPAAAGMLAPTSEADMEDDELLALARDSLERYPQWVGEVEAASGTSTGFRKEGTLWAAIRRDDLADLEHLGETLVRRGLAARPLGAGELLELEPLLSGRVLGGLRIDSDLQVDPRALSLALERAVLRLGGRIETGVRVRAVELERGCVRSLVVEGAGHTERRAVSRVVVAAGAWSSDGIDSPLSSFGVRPVKGQLLRLRGAVLLRHVIRHPDVYLVPREDGELLVGATMEEMGFDARPTAGGVYELLRRAADLLPGLSELHVAELCVGLRPMSRDNRPVLGETAVEGLFAACGHGRQGILLAPVTAHYVAEAIEGRVWPDLLVPFGAGRLAGSGVGEERSTG